LLTYFGGFFQRLMPPRTSAFSGDVIVRVTLTLDDELVARAQSLTGLQKKSALIQEALKQLIAREAGRGLARLGGKEPQSKAPPRRRSHPK
jgi:Arc/MetJ family transcription regulator